MTTDRVPDDVLAKKAAWFVLGSTAVVVLALIAAVGWLFF